MWHLATHADDRRRLVAEPELMPTAIEEFLRAYAPVTMARRLSDDVDFGGCPMKAGDRILMNFPAANRDPDVFPDADKVILDRLHNRHVAFGAGIHRCAGSNLARMEIRVAVEEWLARMPDFEVTDPALVTWAGGQVPRTTIHPHSGQLSTDTKHIEPAAEGGWIRRLWPFLAAHKRDVVIALGASVVGQAANGVGPDRAEGSRRRRDRASHPRRQHRGCSCCWRCRCSRSASRSCGVGSVAESASGCSTDCARRSSIG